MHSRMSSKDTVATNNNRSVTGTPMSNLTPSAASSTTTSRQSYRNSSPTPGPGTSLPPPGLPPHFNSNSSNNHNGSSSLPLSRATTISSPNNLSALPASSSSSHHQHSSSSQIHPSSSSSHHSKHYSNVSQSSLTPSSGTGASPRSSFSSTSATQTTLMATQPLTNRLRPSTSASISSSSSSALSPSSSSSGPSSSLFPSDSALEVPHDMDTESWKYIPYSLTKLIRSIIHQESELTRSLYQTRLQQEQMVHTNSSYVTLSQLHEKISGTMALQIELQTLKQSSNETKHWMENKFNEIESQLAKIAAELQIFNRQMHGYESASRIINEQVTNNIRFAQRDIKERGLIMARLGDKLMDEVNDQRIKNNVLEDKITSFEKKLFVLIQQQATNAAAAAGAPHSHIHELRAKTAASSSSSSSSSSPRGLPTNLIPFSPLDHTSSHPLAAITSISSQSQSQSAAKDNLNNNNSMGNQNNLFGKRGSK